MKSDSVSYKQKIAEWTPFGLFLLTGVCYLMRNNQGYANVFQQIDFCLKACFAFCIWGLLIASSYNWGNLSKGSLAGLFLFNVINYLDEFVFSGTIDSVYYTAFIVVWLVIMLLITLSEYLCKKYRILKP